MRNVTLPVPVFAAGVVMCLLAGYLLGMVTGPVSSSATTATVTSYQPRTQRLCLEGKAIADQEGADGSKICGVWRRTDASTTPVKGDEFKFVSVATSGKYDGQTQKQVVIYGDVVKK